VRFDKEPLVDKTKNRGVAKSRYRRRPDVWNVHVGIVVLADLAMDRGQPREEKSRSKEHGWYTTA
ncbi:unnamed protein product, partial [Symbiodinium sp. CCMP2592]